MPAAAMAAAGTARAECAEPGLLPYYEALESASADMLCAAREGDWERVACIEDAAARLIAQLRRRQRDQAPAAGDDGARLRIMRRIVENDAEVRYLAQPGLRRLDALLSGQRLH